jgi:excisionase family DNA binding protein
MPNNFFDGEQLYTVGEIASTLRISQPTVIRAIQSGRLEAYRVGGQWRITGEAAERFLQNSERGEDADQGPS